MLWLAFCVYLLHSPAHRPSASGPAPVPVPVPVPVPAPTPVRLKFRFRLKIRAGFRSGKRLREWMGTRPKLCSPLPSIHAVRDNGQTYLLLQAHCMHDNRGAPRFNPTMLQRWPLRSSSKWCWSRSGMLYLRNRGRTNNGILRVLDAATMV